MGHPEGAREARRCAHQGGLPFVKLHALHGSVVSAGVTVLLGLCNPPRRGCGEPAKPGLLYPLVWIHCYVIVFAEVGKQSRLLNM
jgi:hypothetical protein